jgi:ERCC4-related helicase
VAGFLLRCIEGHCEVAYPKELRGKQRFLKPPDYLAEVYTAPEVIRAYRAVAQGKAMPYWSSKAFESIIGMPRTEWNNLSNSRRKSIFNRQVNLAKALIAESLATSPYCDHPLEHDIASKLTREPVRAFICVRRREHAIFLASRLNFLLSDADRKAAALTGAGQGVRKGISPKEREENLSAFNHGDATILDATSAGYEGLNIHADFGAAIEFDRSERKATQSQGRVGRHGSQNQFTYYCMSKQDYAKVLTILRKFIKVAEQRNAERAAITKDAGLPPLEEPEIKLCFDLPRGSGGDTAGFPF